MSANPELFKQHTARMDIHTKTLFTKVRDNKLKHSIKKTHAAVHVVESNSRNTRRRHSCDTETLLERHGFTALTFEKTVVYSPGYLSRPSCYQGAPVFSVRVSSSSPSALSEQLLLSYSDTSSLQQTTNTTAESSPLGCRGAEEHCPKPENTQLHTLSGQEMY